MNELVVAEERVRTLVAAARRRNEGFKAVCEKLGVDAEEADGLVTEFVPDPSDDAVVMHALLVGVLAGRQQGAEEERERLLNLIFGEYDLLDRDCGWPVKREEITAALDIQEAP